MCQGDVCWENKNCDQPSCPSMDVPRDVSHCHNAPAVDWKLLSQNNGGVKWKIVTWWHGPSPPSLNSQQAPQTIEETRRAAKERGNWTQFLPLNACHLKDEWDDMYNCVGIDIDIEGSIKFSYDYFAPIKNAKKHRVIKLKQYFDVLRKKMCWVAWWYRGRRRMIYQEWEAATVVLTGPATPPPPP